MPEKFKQKCWIEREQEASGNVLKLEWYDISRYAINVFAWKKEKVYKVLYVFSLLKLHTKTVQV